MHYGAHLVSAPFTFRPPTVMTESASPKPRFRPSKSRLIEEQVATAFFGRRKGKPLSPTQLKLVDELLPTISINPSEPVSDIQSIFAHAPQKIWLEIGFGGGEHMVRQAMDNPDVGIIGCEPFINGAVKALGQIEKEGIDTIRMYDEDAAHVLDWLPDASIDRIFLLYPDPWHKKRHWKRRFVSDRNLKRFVRVLKPGGIFRFASDIEDYVEWTLEHVAAVPELVEQCQNPAERLEAYPDWKRTRYEEKAFREGRKPQYLSFLRI